MTWSVSPSDKFFKIWGNSISCMTLQVLFLIAASSKALCQDLLLLPYSQSLGHPLLSMGEGFRRALVAPCCTPTFACAHIDSFMFLRANGIIFTCCLWDERME